MNIKKPLRAERYVTLKFKKRAIKLIIVFVFSLTTILTQSVCLSFDEMNDHIYPSERSSDSPKIFHRFDSGMLMDMDTGKLHPIIEDRDTIIDIKQNKMYHKLDEDMLIDQDSGSLIPIMK